MIKKVILKVTLIHISIILTYKEYFSDIFQKNGLARPALRKKYLYVPK